MRILIHSNSPMSKSGYGKQCGALALMLRDLGHDVAISAFTTPDAFEWNGMKCYPGGYQTYGNGVAGKYAAEHRADLVILLCDQWLSDPAEFAGFNVAVWTPVDSEPLSALENLWTREAARHVRSLRLIAMSEFGREQLAAAGHESAYIPHSIDTAVFAPPDDRDETREKSGIGYGIFTISMLGINRSGRKHIPVQLRAVARLRKDHPGICLRLHCDPRPVASEAWDLTSCLQSLGLGDITTVPDLHLYETGGYPDEVIAAYYGTSDVLLHCSMAEGFGLPVIEAQACGTPVIATRFSAMAEHVPQSCGWLVDAGERWWNTGHRSWWAFPREEDIYQALLRACKSAGRKRADARMNALQYDHAAVRDLHWVPWLEKMQADLA